MLLPAIAETTEAHFDGKLTTTGWCVVATASSILSIQPELTCKEYK